MLEAFQQVKDALSSSPCLKLPDPNGEFEVTTDASEGAKAVGTVLTQNGHPVAFESKKLNPHQLNYAVHDKEMCAIIYALERWRPFLLGRHFKCYKDHRSLARGTKLSLTPTLRTIFNTSYGFRKQQRTPLQMPNKFNRGMQTGTGQKRRSSRKEIGFSYGGNKGRSAS
jgi:hypothetical protein